MNLLSAPELPALNLIWLALPVAVTVYVFVASRMGQGRRLGEALLRAGIQLSVVGYVLVPLFNTEHSLLVLMVVSVMCALAAFFSLGVLRGAKGKASAAIGLRLWPLAFMAILPVVLGLTLFATWLLLEGIAPTEPRYALTLAGMLAGNAMNATALAGERFLSGVKNQRDLIEFRLAQGLDGKSSVAPLVSDALRAAVTPSLNGLFAVGLVSLPGMMTGQMMAGESPLPAARYQMMIMVLWLTAATLAPRIFLFLVSTGLMANDRIAEERSPGERKDFRLAEEAGVPAPPVAGGAAYEERPPDALNRGFIGKSPD